MTTDAGGDGADEPLLQTEGEGGDKGDSKLPTFRSNVRRAYAQHQATQAAAGMLTALRNPSTSPFMVQVEETDQVPIRKVTFDPNSHFSVLFQMHGSVWPSVLPFCLVNVILTYLVALAKRHGVDLTFPSDGHTFMAIMVSFLIVTRCNITYGRFMEARGYLSDLFRSCRELMQFTAVLTMVDVGRGAKQWRQDVAYRTILLLRVTIAALEFRSSHVNTWDILPDQMRSSLEVYLPSEAEGGGGGGSNRTGASPSTPLGGRMMKWAHGVRTLSDENFRAPIVLAYNLRVEIMKQRNGQLLKIVMHPNEELKLLGFVSDYVTAFHGLKKLITTPFPFPLVQMARTFLFFWIFTLPFAIVREISEPVQAMIIMFFTTYGFVGLEYVSMEMDDPFGDDPNDFDDLGMAQMVFEDIYITLYKLDGSKMAEELWEKVAKRVVRTSMYQQGLDDDMASPASTGANIT